MFFLKPIILILKANIHLVKIPRTIYLFLQWGESKDIPGNRRWIRGAKGVGKAHTDKTNEEKITRPEIRKCNGFISFKAFALIVWILKSFSSWVMNRNVRCCVCWTFDLVWYKGFAMSHMEMCIHEKEMNEKAQSLANNAEIKRYFPCFVQKDI